MTYFRKNKRESNISPEMEQWFATTGENLLSVFQERIQRGKNSRRGNHYDTQPDHSFHSAEQRTNRMEDRV